MSAGSKNHIYTLNFQKDNSRLETACCFLIGFFVLFSSERCVCSFVSDLSQNVEFFKRIGTGKFKNLSNQLGIDYGRSVFVPHIGDGKSFSEAVVCGQNFQSVALEKSVAHFDRGNPVRPVQDRGDKISVGNRLGGKKVFRFVEILSE